MKNILRIFGVIIVIVLVIAAIVASTTNKPSNSDKVWDEQMTTGNLEAKNYYIIYSDLVCPYCIAFENAIVEHEEEFQQFITDNDILVEVRLSDFLHEYGETKPINSLYSAEAAYCAKNEGKFWDYYNLAVTRVWDEFFDGAGKAGVTKMANINKDYWINLGKEIGLGEEFETCVKEDQPLAEIEANAAKTAKLANGMPYFKFNNYTNSGFDLSWGWEYVKMYLQAGLEN